MNRLRSAIASRLTEGMKTLCQDTHSLWVERNNRLQWCIRLNRVSKGSEISGSQIGVSKKWLKDCGLLETVQTSNHDSLLENLSKKIKTDSLLQNISTTKDHLCVGINQSDLTREVLMDISAKGSDCGKSSGLYEFIPCQSLEGSIIKRHVVGQSVIVEYSSPNIAKPFHAGHLRSTVIGQFVANINEWFGQNVVRINYLGDWGTQFGLLGVGFKKHGSYDRLQADPLKHLFDVYVQINKDASANDAVHAEGMAYFKRMEEGDKEALAFWETCRLLSVEEYSKMYERLGIQFTHVHGEAMYSETAKKLVEDLKSSDLLLFNKETGVGYMELTQPQDKVPFYANLVKSDGTTLYLTRDVVAAMDRREKFSADKLYYVVENGQHVHFKQLLRILRRLGQWWAVHLLDDVHLKFGRVAGMSTRRGEVVLLRDILDEAKALMLERMRSKNTTKVFGEEEQLAVAETLGVSAIIIQDLKEYRKNNYKFSWDRMLNFNGDTGVFLHYTHARLNSIVSSPDLQHLTSSVPDFESLVEDSARRLIIHLGRFDEVLLQSYSDLEACHLVHYLFTLGRLVNVAHDELYVKGQPPKIARDRMALFESSKTILSAGMKILGIVPLNKI